MDQMQEILTSLVKGEYPLRITGTAVFGASPAPALLPAAAAMQIQNNPALPAMLPPRATHRCLQLRCLRLFYHLLFLLLKPRLLLALESLRYATTRISAERRQKRARRLV